MVYIFLCGRGFCWGGTLLREGNPRVLPSVSNPFFDVCVSVGGGGREPNREY